MSAGGGTRTPDTCRRWPVPPERARPRWCLTASSRPPGPPSPACHCPSTSPRWSCRVSARSSGSTPPPSARTRAPRPPPTPARGTPAGDLRPLGLGPTVGVGDDRQRSVKPGPEALGQQLVGLVLGRALGLCARVGKPEPHVMDRDDHHAEDHDDPDDRDHGMAADVSAPPLAPGMLRRRLAALRRPGARRAAHRPRRPATSSR
jgi:hypothetical protein